jgi:hypothetical protein
LLANPFFRELLEGVNLYSSYLLGRKFQQSPAQSHQASLHELHNPIPTASTQYDKFEISSAASLQKGTTAYNAGSFENILLPRQLNIESQTAA